MLFPLQAVYNVLHELQFVVQIRTGSQDVQSRSVLEVFHVMIRTVLLQ